MTPLLCSGALRDCADKRPNQCYETTGQAQKAGKICAHDVGATGQTLSATQMKQTRNLLDRQINHNRFRRATIRRSAVYLLGYKHPSTRCGPAQRKASQTLHWQL